MSVCCIFLKKTQRYISSFGWEWLTHCAESSTVNIYLMYEDKVVQMHPEDNQENFCNITVHLQENLKKETFPIFAKSLIFGKWRQ